MSSGNLVCLSPCPLVSPILSKYGIKQHFQGGVNHFEDGPEAPIEVKLILIKLKMPQRLVGVFAHVKAGVSLFHGDFTDGEDSGGQVNTFEPLIIVELIN